MNSVNPTLKMAAVLLVPVLALFASQMILASGPAKNQSLPLANAPYVLGDKIDAYSDFMMSGGPPPDGIPSVDRPDFINALRARLDPGDMVIGVYHRGEARAYPQNIMVHHEIVNDEIGGLNVAITYCPLTATSQGFKRGNTTFGVSGQLLNSNMVIFDRESKSYFSQINATGLRGRHRGRSLDEINLIWTTWGRWSAEHPETKVLSERTGHLRNYNRDPYGSYNPIGGYYSQSRTTFPLMHESERHHSKKMIVGGRNAQRSVYFVLEELAREKVLYSDNFLAVYHPGYGTGYIYETGGRDIRIEAHAGGRYDFEGQHYAAADLPLDSVIPVDGFFFAWNAFYPNSERGTVSTASSSRGSDGAVSSGPSGPPGVR